MDMTQDHLKPEANEGNAPLSRLELLDILQDIETQPPWRAKADREMEFLDGNQLDSELLRKQRALGIPPAVENIMKPTIDGIVGMEAKMRTDWRLTPEGGPQGQDVADALNFQLNQAERQSKADRACSDAFRPQLCVGLGWVEVARESDPTRYKYRCGAVNRNEIWWEGQDREDRRLLNSRWLLRKRWMDPRRLKLAFKKHKAIIESCASGRYDEMMIGIDGGTSTGLTDGTGSARGWTLQEQAWFDPQNKYVCLYEVWYRRWVEVAMLITPDGRAVEFDENNDAHIHAVARGLIMPQLRMVARMRRAYWMGPHCLDDSPSPYSHPYFPYVPFWGMREDATGVPYGELRAMMFPQETLNSGISKLRWGMSAVRTERTKGAVSMTDAQFRQTVARVDADIVLDAEHMKEPGARFEVKRDYQLSEQHYRMVEDARAAIERVGPGTAGFLGKEGTATSGLQEQTQVEQSTQRLAGLMDNFREGRTVVGEILLSFLIEDIGNQRQVVVIEGDAVRPNRTVVLNGPELDPETNRPYLSNDVQRTRLKVALEDVPTTSSFRAQQLNALSESVKSMSESMQQAVAPFMIGLMDLPHKREIVEAIRAAGEQESAEAAQQRRANDLKEQELSLKYSPDKLRAEIENIVADTVVKGVTAAFSAMQAGAQVATMPMIAPIADEVMKGAGYRQPSPSGDDPNFPTPTVQAAMNIKSPYLQGQGPAVAPADEDSEAAGTAPVRENTSPAHPPVPQQPASAQTGIETLRTVDNVPT